MKKRIVSFLLALVMAVSLLPVSAFAADGVYTVAKDATVTQGDDNTPVVQADESSVFEIKINEASSAGSVTLQGTEYPLYKLDVDGSKYDTIRMLKETGTVTVSGAEKKFPSTAHIADTNGSRDIAEKTARECYPEIRDFTYDILWNDLPKEVQDQLTNER